MRISDWSSDVCSSDLRSRPAARGEGLHRPAQLPLCGGVVGLRPLRRLHLVALDEGRVRAGRFEGVKNPALTRYRIMATIVGVLLIVLIQIGRAECRERVCQ